VQGGGSQALNPYSYIQNNPLSGTDPSGYASQKDECAGTKGGGCTAADQEVKATRAATLTGSHIKGGSGSSNIEVVMVNPSAGGMAELAVAMAGSSSGYVVQLATTDMRSTNVVSSDVEGVSHRFSQSDGGASRTDGGYPVEKSMLNDSLSMVDVPSEELKRMMRSSNPEDRVAAARAAIREFGISSDYEYVIVYAPRLKFPAETYPNFVVHLGPRAYESWSKLGSVLGHEIEVHIQQFAKSGPWTSGKEYYEREVEAYLYNLDQRNLDRYRNFAPEIADFQWSLRYSRGKVKEYGR
jgi:hypothetical protein